MPIAKHRDNLSDLVSKAAKRRDRVNNRKRRLSTVHVSVPMASEVSKLKKQRRQVAFESSNSVDSLEDESEGGSPEQSSRLLAEKDSIMSECVIVLQAHLSFLSTYVYTVVEHSYWKCIRMLFTGLAIYTLAGEVSLLNGRAWSDFFYWSNGIVNTFFVTDGLLKLWSFFGYLKIEERFSAKNSLYGSLRRCGIIDFSIASLCFYFASSRTGSWLKLVRVMFIALFGVQQLSSLDVLMSGIGFGLHSVFYTWLLLVLVFIVYGAAGVTFYAENDPYHFGTIAISMWTFFQISTMDDWIEVMLINSYGCDVYPAMYYPGPEVVDIDHYGHFYLPVCTAPTQQRFVSIVLFFTFIVVVGFILMSLTIAAVTAGINDRLDNLQKEELREELSGLNNQLLSNEESSNIMSQKLSQTGKVSKSISNLLRLDSQGNMDGHLSADPALLRLMLFQVLNVKKKSDFSSAAASIHSVRKLKRLSQKGSHEALAVTPSPDVLATVNSENKDQNSVPPTTNKASELDSKIVKIAEVNENASSRNTMSTSSNTMLGNSRFKFVMDHCRHMWEELSIQQLSLTCRNMSSQKSYNIGLNLFIVFGAGFEVNSLQEDAFAMDGLDMPVNVVLQVIFSIDIIIKVVATYPSYINFWKKKWNRFDVCTVFLLWIALAFNFQGLLGRVLKLLRVLRIFRILKLISKIPELNVIMMSIGSSGRALMYIVALMFIFFFHFAVAGIYLFQNNDPFHFDGLVRSFTTLFQVATLDNWGEVARINMLGCNNTDYDLDPPCTDPEGLGWIAAWYFIIFIILGVMVLLSLFVGVIITSMELLKEGLKEEREVLAKVKQLQYKYDISDTSVEHLLEIFDMIDVGSNGKLTLDELKPVLEVVSVTPVQQFEMFVQVDSDRSGQIDFSEFCELIQLIGKIYLDNEEMKGSKIIRRTKTYRRLSNRDLSKNRLKVKSRTNLKYADNLSDAGSEISAAVLLRGGSSGSLVPGNDWSAKGSKDADVNEYNDDDLDKPVVMDDRRKPLEERPRTNGGLWSMFDHSGGPSPLETSPRTLKEVAALGNQSGTLSPVPSALDLLSLSHQPRKDRDEQNADPYTPLFHLHSRQHDDDGEHHFQLRGHTASNKLNLLKGGGGNKSRPGSAVGRPGSAVGRPVSGGPSRPIEEQRRGSKESISDKKTEKVEPALSTIPSNGELIVDDSKVSSNKPADAEHRKLGDFSLADMSVHSLRNINDFSMFHHDEDNSNQAKPTRNKGASSVPEGRDLPEGMELQGIDSWKSHAPHFDGNGELFSPLKSMGSAEEVWSVGGSGDPAAGLSGKK